MSWEVVACCVWVIAIIWCIVEAYFTPSILEEDIDGTKLDEESIPEDHYSPIITKELMLSNREVIEKYREFGCQAVIDMYLSLYLNEDGTLVTQKGLASQVMKIMDINPAFGYDLGNVEKWNEISELISNASIKKGFK